MKNCHIKEIQNLKISGILTLKINFFAREEIKKNTGVKTKNGREKPRKNGEKWAWKRFLPVKKTKNIEKNGFHAHFWFHAQKKNTG